VKPKIRAAIDDLRADPELGSPLHDDLEGFWRLAVGRWRVVYRYTLRLIEVTAVGPRMTIYEALARIRRDR